MELNVSGNARLVVIVTFFVYTAGMLLIGWLAKKNMDRVAINKYIDEFYTGGRGMGAIVVAMMIAAGLFFGWIIAQANGVRKLLGLGG